jgi:hypothetical protein
VYARLVIVGLVAAIAAPAAAPTRESVGTTPSVGVLIHVAQADIGAPPERALFRLSPLTPSKQRLVSERWRVRAWSPKGAVIGVSATAPTGPLHILGGKKAVALQNSSRATCVAVSGNGRLASYVVPAQQAGSPGVLWSVRLRPLSRPSLVDRGLFPTEQCPVWAAGGARLAYAVDHGGVRAVKLWLGRGPQTLATFEPPKVSRYPILDWAPNAAELTFVHGLNLFRYASGRVRRLGEERALAPVVAPRHSVVEAVSWHSLRYSPNGAYVAVSARGRTGVFRADGAAVLIRDGILNGWAGNTGVLISTGGQCAYALVLHNLRPPSDSRVVDCFFKLPVVTDPAGRWFAYVDWQKRLVVFRRPDGRLLRRHSLFGFVPAVFGATRDGRFTRPASAV